MKKIAILGMMFFVIITFAQTKITNNLGDFSTVKIYNGLEVELIKADVNKIEIIGEIYKRVKVTNSNAVLKVALKFPETTANKKVLVKLYFKNILVVDANEGATVTGKNFNQQHLEVNVQEGAFTNLVTQTQHLKVRVSSGGVLKLTGNTKNQTVNVNLGGVYRGYAMKVSDLCMVKSSSGAKAEVLVEETLDAKVSFGGTVFYKGNPKIIKNKKVIGGIIRKKD